MCHFSEHRGVTQRVSKFLTFQNVTSGDRVSLREVEETTRTGPAAPARPWSLLAVTQDANTREAPHLFTGEMRLDC